MSGRYETELLVTAAKLYHLQGLKQEDIATRLKVSRAMVSLMLTEARRLGIIDIQVRDPQLEHTDFGNDLRQRFSLDRCIVVPTSSRDSDVLRELVSARTVNIFADLVEDGDTIGVSWGRTCHAFMSGFHVDRQPRSISVVPLVGTSNKNVSQYHLNEMVRLFASKLSAKPFFLHAPALAPTREDYLLYLQSSDMRMIEDLWNEITLSVVAIGAPPLTEEFDGSDVSDSHLANRKQVNDYLTLPVGNMSARYFNIDGVFLDDEVNQRTIAIPPDSMRRIPKVVAMAAGVERACSVIGALKTGVVNTLVIDESTARATLTILNSMTESEDTVRSLYLAAAGS